MISYIFASILLTLSPGPDNLFVLSESISKGKRTGIWISLGLCCGIFVHTLFAATGVSLIIQQSQLLFSIIKYCGIAYILYLAFKAYQENKTTQFDLSLSNKDLTHKSPLQLFSKGFLMNVLNPKVALFFIAFLPQFISEEGFAVHYQMIILGLVFFIQALIIFGMISILAGKLSNVLKNSRVWLIVQKSSVVVLLLIALMLLFS